MAVDIIARGLAGRADSKAITAYEYAKRAGYTGTEQEFAEDMGNSATNASNARESAEQAQEYAEQAEQTLENKADIDGYYGGMGVGIADNLNVNEKIPLTKPYVLRSTADSEDVAGLYKRTHLTGGSLVWNQLVPETSQTVLGVTKSFSNRKFHITGTATGNGTLNVVSAVQPNHVYAFIGNFDLPEDFSGFIIRDITKSQNLVNLYGGAKVTPFLYKLPSDTSEVRAYFIVKNGVTYNFDYLYMCIDLTTTFGTTFANAIYSMNDHGVAWLYANFPELNGGYIPYSAPHFEHSKYKGVTSNGVNQLTAGFVIGKQWSNGVVIDAGNSSAVVIDKYKCLPNTTYAITLPHINRTNVYAYAVFFDINGNYISSERNTLESDNHMVFTTPSNCYLFSFQVWRSGAVDFTESELADPCVVIHYDTSYDGISEPYESWYTDLGSDVLKGIPVADDYTGSNVWSGKWHWEGDTKTPDGTITEKWYVTDFDGSSWASDPANNNGIIRFVINASGTNIPAKASGKSNIISSMFDTYTGGSSVLPADTTQELVSGNASSSHIYVSIKASRLSGDLTTVAGRSSAFNTWITNNNFLIMYELATPTTSQGTAYEENEQCHNWGIQWIEDAEYDDGNRAFKMPMGGEEVYTPNITEKVEAMPSAPVNNGDYIVRVANNKAEYIPYTGDARMDEIEAELENKIGVITITDPTTTMGTIENMLAEINANGDHVVFDVSALGTGMYLCTIYIGSGFYRINDMVTGFVKEGFFKHSDLLVDILNSTPSTTGKHYTMQWDKVNAKGTRLNDAVSITDDTSNFGHFGSVNENYDNPFDSIYPWSGRKLCNIDIPTYRALTSADDITDCVVAWEDDANFDYNHQYGVWVYTPAFFGRTYELGNYRYFDVTDEFNQHNISYPAMITARWLGVDVELSIDGTSKHCNISKQGMPIANVTIANQHLYATNWGASLDDIYSLDASTLLFVVEYGTLNSQTALGSGCANLYKQSMHPDSAVTGGNVISVTATGLSAALLTKGAIVDIGTSDGGYNVARTSVVSATLNGNTATITLADNVTVAVTDFVSLHGIINNADEDIGSMSGYIGTNGYVNAYYRGEALWGNKYYYVLGAYRQTGTQHIWIADRDDTDNYDALNTSEHTDTGLVLPNDTNEAKSGYVNKLGIAEGLSIPPFATEIGGNSANPVGDYVYVPATSNGNTVLLVGGAAGDGASAGLFSGLWRISSASSYWSLGSRPRLKTP